MNLFSIPKRTVQAFSQCTNSLYPRIFVLAFYEQSSSASVCLSSIGTVSSVPIVCTCLLISLAFSHWFRWCNNIWVVPVADGQLLRRWSSDLTAHTQWKMRAGGFDTIRMVGNWTRDLRESSRVSVREMIPPSQRRAERNFTLSINFSHLSQSGNWETVSQVN